MPLVIWEKQPQGELASPSLEPATQAGRPASWVEEVCTTRAWIGEQRPGHIQNPSSTSCAALLPGNLRGYEPIHCLEGWLAKG